MQFEKIEGLIDAPFTPFHANGDINLDPIPAYASMLAKNGLKGVFINGSSGEGYMLTTDERMQLAEACEEIDEASRLAAQAATGDRIALRECVETDPAMAGLDRLYLTEVVSRMVAMHSDILGRFTQEDDD